MKILLTRDSVAMGDDVDAPHFHTLELPEKVTLIEIVDTIHHSNYLANIHGGNASWSVVSNSPIAVIAQQWNKPKLFPQFELIPSLDCLLKNNEGYKFHLNYHAQLDPNIVYEVLRRFKKPS